MSLLTPAAALLGLLAAPIILLYMLRLRREERTISSTLLWQELVVDRAANAPWQRLKRNLLLVLQLLILAALVLALARPLILSPGRIDGNVIVILDASASMTATDMDGQQSRYEEAVRQAIKTIDDLGGSDRMTLISAGSVPKVLASQTDDKTLLRQALASSSPEYSDADWPSAFALAAGSAQGLNEPVFVIISDGNLPESLPPLPGEIRFNPIGRSGENMTITAMGIRPSAGQHELLVSAHNFSQSSSLGLLTIYLDDELFDSRQIEIGANENAHFSWSLPFRTGIVEARLDPVGESEDYLAVDNRAWTILEDRNTAQILLVGDGNLFLERLFAVLPGYEITRTGEADFDVSAEENRAYDLFIFDGVPIPDPLPPGNILIFDPQPTEESSVNSSNIQVTDVFTTTEIIRVAGDLRVADIDWSEIHIAQARSIIAPTLDSLIDTGRGSLLMAGEHEGRRIAIFPFDLSASDFPLQIAFPVIMANIIEWLHTGPILAVDDSVKPGEIVTIIPDSSARWISVQSPDGEIWEHEVSNGYGPVLFPNTSQTGVYTVTLRNELGVEQIAGRFSINFFPTGDSRILPATSLIFGQTEVESGSQPNFGRIELWPYVLLVGLILITLEWWISYQSRFKRRELKLR